MRLDDFRDLLRNRPFRAFRLRLSNGAEDEVRQPELAVLARSVVWIHLPVKNYPLPVAEHKVGVVLIHIVVVEFIEPASTPSAN
jgi:hypothetical protein